jgi:hypothetical protein
MKLSGYSLMIALGVFVAVKPSDAGDLRTFTVDPNGSFVEDDPTVCPLLSNDGKHPQLTVDNKKTVKSYSMPNGNAACNDALHCRYFGCYQDLHGPATQSHAFLEGCTGELTDGYVPVTSCHVDFGVTNLPCVGWRMKEAACTAAQDPAVVVDFFFPTDEGVYTICITYDDPGMGGVATPKAIEIQGTINNSLLGGSSGPV